MDARSHLDRGASRNQSRRISLSRAEEAGVLPDWHRNAVDFLRAWSLHFVPFGISNAPAASTLAGFAIAVNSRCEGRVGRDTMHHMSTTDETRDDTTPADTYHDDTIAAIATPPGVGGLGIVRMSGPEAFAVGLRIFRPAPPLSESELPPSHQLLYGHVVDPASDTAI